MENLEFPNSDVSSKLIDNTKGVTTPSSVILFLLSENKQRKYKSFCLFFSSHTDNKHYYLLSSLHHGPICEDYYGYHPPSGDAVAVVTSGFLRKSLVSHLGTQLAQSRGDSIVLLVVERLPLRYDSNSTWRSFS